MIRIEGWASVEEPDCVGDVLIASGAAWHLTNGGPRAPKLFYAHDDHNQTPVGRVLSLEQRKHPSGKAGLWITAVVLDTAVGKDLQELMRHQRLSFSLGFFIVDADLVSTATTDLVHLTKTAIFECSIVSNPCVRNATIEVVEDITAADLDKLTASKSAPKPIGRSTTAAIEALRQFNKDQANV
mgnify:CR=1 FL=1